MVQCRFVISFPASNPQNPKFRVSKLQISSLQTQNFEFANSKQENQLRNGVSLKGHRIKLPLILA